MKINPFKKMDDYGIGKIEEKTSSDHFNQDEKQPEFDEIGTALNEI